MGSRDVKKQNIEFKAYKGHELRLHTWAVEGHAADTEREVYQIRLNRGDFSRVEMVEIGKTTTLLRREDRNK